MTDTDDTLTLLLIETDEIIRLGLRTWLAKQTGVASVFDTNTVAQALDTLEDSPVDVIIIGDFASGLRLAQTLEPHPPESPTPILLWCSALTVAQLALARRAGLGGYCAKGTPPRELFNAALRLLAGEQTWQAPARIDPEADITNPPPAHSAPSSWVPGIQYIEAEQEQLERWLRDPNLTLLQRIIFNGRRRELNAARWLLCQVRSPRRVPGTPPQPSPVSPPSRPSTALVQSDGGAITSANLASEDLEDILLDAILSKLQPPLRNLSDTPLEIEILRTSKRRQLLVTALRSFQNLLSELRHSDISPSRLRERRDRLALDLWRETTQEFFGRYYTLSFNGESLELVDILLREAEVVQSAILDKIPFLPELLSHLLFQTPLAVDDRTCEFGSPEATLRAEYLLHNLLIAIANGVTQPLLDQVTGIETIERQFYDRRFLSTRDIERLRNDLSWKYRWETYLEEPRAIYESRFWLFVLTERGIKRMAIYAHRREEFLALSGVRQAVTLVLEGRDALAPRLRSVVSWVGNGLVYVLTQVLGRGIGLVGRGVLENLGSGRTRASRSGGKE
ncbi:DUF3685 domain-containing protein [Sodalinema gerasimenkoae]|uniref:DUF3685 domain-containing protein n=1 Tax=Sodalinema gerasimenkoae TaxID=2862348 RepID=UPI001356B048|nr:DUF3685 domain-containing protein [Sodalinema gerasimenkoae]